MGRFDGERQALEDASGGKNTILLDDVGMPSVMVRIPKFKIKDVLEGGSDAWHPMFVVNGQVKDCIYISKYGNIIEGERAYSLPAWDPGSYVNLDTAKAACERKGRGWHLFSNAEWAGIAMWCKANGFIPHGNNYVGCDVAARWEKGVQSLDWVLDYNWNEMANSGSGEEWHHTGRVLTGSGPDTWSHDGTPYGIFDLNGNMWEWVSGMRLMDGEVQIILNNNSAAAVDESRSSTLWRSILQNGTIVNPGAAATLKYDSIVVGDANQTNHGLGALQLNTLLEHPQYVGGSTEEYFGYGNNAYETFVAKSGVVAPEILKVLGLYPYDAKAGGHNADGFWVRNYGERCPIRGGDWYNAVGAGVFALDLGHPRSHAGSDLGFRSAFVEL